MKDIEMAQDIKPLSKRNVERLERFKSPYYKILTLLKESGMKHSEAKVWAANYQYPQVADDIMARIEPLLRKGRQNANAKRREKD